jgi:citrate lyase subunit gamma (acyl carrier protein)
MKKVLKAAQAGTLESSDAIVTVAPGETGDAIRIDIESSVLLQYGDAICGVVEQTLNEQGVTGVHVKVTDRGALDCTLRARVLAALARADVAIEEVFR